MACLSCNYIMNIGSSLQCPNVSTTPIMAMGCRQCLPLSVVQLKGKHCRKPHCRNGVVDTFGLCQQLNQELWKGIKVRVQTQKMSLVSDEEKKSGSVETGFETNRQADSRFTFLRPLSYMFIILKKSLCSTCYQKHMIILHSNTAIYNCCSYSMIKR